LRAVQAQAQLEELSQRYNQLMADLRAKHSAAGCNLTPAQKWSCPPPPAAKEPADGNPSPAK
jgi:hypothetical protein